MAEVDAEPRGAVTWQQIAKVGSVVIAIAGATWQVSEYTHGLTDRLARLEEQVKRIDDKLERWHRTERAQVDRPEAMQ